MAQYWFERFARLPVDIDVASEFRYVAEAAKVGVATIRRIESQEGPLTGYISTLLKIQAALEQAGIQFIDEDETGGFGLWMAMKKRKRSPQP